MKSDWTLKSNSSVMASYVVVPAREVICAVPDVPRSLDVFPTVLGPGAVDTLPVDRMTPDVIPIWEPPFEKLPWADAAPVRVALLTTRLLPARSSASCCAVGVVLTVICA
ncbi:hypothetical protein SDC9_135556 [bioreactor metagenome]|uniref:Uncharacterized protein n=1 Tax=bioreactor metagenome TaxID=1076179 RepID=A0A645DIM6_9ZZZZ